MQKTTMLKNEKALADRKWYIIDAKGAVLGKLAVEAAKILRGKNKTTFTPNIDCGDFVIIKNSNGIVLSSNKNEREFWYNHSHYIGGLRKRSGKEMIEKYSDELIETAIKGMLPKNRLGRKLLKKLKVYKNEGLDHSAQSPILVEIKQHN